MDTPDTVQEQQTMETMCITTVTVDTVLVVAPTEDVNLVVPGQEELHCVYEVRCLNFECGIIHITYLFTVYHYVVILDRCPCPPSPSNGYTRSCYSTDYVGGYVYYYCNSGYLLKSGDSPRRCLLGGNWTGNEPVCEKG